VNNRTLQFGPWALGTGANSGIGAAFAETLAKQGYSLALVGRRADALDAVSERLTESYSIKTQSVVVDLSASEFLARLVSQTRNLDIGLLVSNAGDDAMGALLRNELNDLTTMLRLNTEVHLKLAHHFGRLFETRGRGGIVLVSSTAALQGTPFLANYAGAKSYLLNMGMALNYEMRGTGVNVTVVVPGPTRAPGLLEKPAIPLSKLPAPAMSPADVARVGLSALARNKPYVIAGVVNRVVARMGSLIGRTGARNMWGGLIKGIVPAPLSVR
jgi:uncharacterized protein